MSRELKIQRLYQEAQEYEQAYRRSQCAGHYQDARRWSRRARELRETARKLQEESSPRDE